MHTGIAVHPHSQEHANRSPGDCEGQDGQEVDGGESLPAGAAERKSTPESNRNERQCSEGKPIEGVEEEVVPIAFAAVETGGNIALTDEEQGRNDASGRNQELKAAFWGAGSHG